MKGFNMNSTNNFKLRGFTLIELLVVISIIAILAGLLLAIAGPAKQKMAIRRVEAERDQVQSAIEAYKSKLGHYPPDGANGVASSPLYYELVGCQLLSNGSFAPMDGSPTVTPAQLTAAFGAGVTGIINSGPATASDDGSTAHRFLKGLKPAQYGTGPGGVRVLGVGVDGPATAFSINPYRYKSSNPTNNVNTFDLWADITFGKKTNRISNWRTTPIINP